MNSKHPAEVYTKLAEANPFLSNKKIAAILGVDEASVRRAFKKVGYRRGLVPPEDTTPQVLETVDAPIRVYGDALLIADLHIPLHDFAYLREAVDDAWDRNIKIVIFCGDVLHGDQYSSYFPKQIPVDEELPIAVDVVEWVLSHFESAYFIRGNHDYRYVKARGYKVSFIQAMQDAFKGLSDKAKAKLTFSNLDHLYLFPEDYQGFPHPESLGDGWYICHPQAYSRQPLAGARALTTVQDMNCATAHSHHCARGFGPNGKYQAMELGGFFDAARTAYLQSSTAFPRWTQGFAWYKDGKMHLENPTWSTND